jgi:ring-1,2-phenylacetyl-CoA epoxidase subunit PaaE
MLEFVKQYFTSVLGALSILSIVYLIFWVLFGRKLSNRKIQLSKRAGWPQIKGEIGATLVSFIGSTLLMLLLLSFKDNGLAKFYNEAGKYGIWYEVLTVFILVLASDTWFYWSHRVMHHPSIYKYVHALHHKSLDVNPFTSTSFHMIEAVWLTLFLIPIIFIMPVSMTALGIVQVLGTFNNLKSHLGYELFPGFFSKVPPFNMLVTATNHSLHHTQYNGNYGLFFRFWDILCGTELNTTRATFDEIHDRENETIIDNTMYRVLKIDNLVKENDETVSVYFKPTTKPFYNYKAGQYLTLKVKVDGKIHDRCFSISSSPNLDDFLRITVKLKGEVSHYFYNDAKIGDNIEALLPVGDFAITPNPKITNQYVMIAGGSGITPLYSMIRQILHFEPLSKVCLLYANSNEESIIFSEELDLLAEQYSQLTYKKFISGKSRICKEDLASFLDASFYICGPDKLKAGMNNYLKELKVSKENINIEHFADGYVPWFGLVQNKSMAISKRAAVFMVVIFIYCTTAFGQTEFIGGSWKDKAHPEKVVTFLKSDNNIIGKDSKNKVIFKSIKLLKNNQYQGILINPDDNEEFKVNITLSSKNEFKFKVKKFIFSKEFTFVRN